MASGIDSRRPVLAFALALTLAACGGSGAGGIASTPPPLIENPTQATNSNIASLVANQSFANNAAVGAVSIDLASRTTGTGTSAKQTLTISYDASARSYTLAEPVRTTTFAAADVQSSANGETRYSRSTGSTRDVLTVVTTPYTNSTANRYVALGFYQRNDLSGNNQQTGFETFAFGLDTPITALPRTGLASWRTDVFGLYTVPNQTPRTVQGSGDFTVNFNKALFSSTTSVVQYDFLTGASVSGGGIDIVAQGAISSGNGFSGNVTYGGTFGAVGGTITGRFYGPNAEEIGAAFHADNAAGATLTGALTGQRKSTATATSFTLDSIASDQLFYSQWAVVAQRKLATGNDVRVQSPVYAQTTFRPDGSFVVGTPLSDLPEATFTAADRLATSRPGFASYQKTVNGNTVRVDLYSPAGSQGIALTYAGFGIWSSNTPDFNVARTTNGYLTYGFTTPRDLLSRRSGSGSYDGVAYGSAVPTAAAGGSRYDVTGASHFDVDFSAQRYSGSLALNVTPEGGGTAAALGTWMFGATLQSGLLNPATLNANGASHPLNTIEPRFYGPDGEEIAATFSIANGATVAGQDVAVAGVAAAKRR